MLCSSCYVPGFQMETLLQALLMHIYLLPALLYRWTDKQWQRNRTIVRTVIWMVIASQNAAICKCSCLEFFVWSTLWFTLLTNMIEQNSSWKPNSCSADEGILFNLKICCNGCQRTSLITKRFAIPVVFNKLIRVERMYWSNKTVFDVRDMSSTYHIMYSYMFRRLTMAIFRLYMKYLVSKSDVWLTVHRNSVWIRKTN